jgi:hypothetical protein
VGCNKKIKIIEEYIKDQMKEDMMTDQLTIKEFVDPFKGYSVTIPCGWQNRNVPLGTASIRPL